jgi:hypothetical protein
MFHKKRSIILLVSIVVVVGFGAFAISRVFVFASPATQPTIVSSPFVPPSQADNARSASNDPGSRDAGVPSGQPQLTTDESDKMLKRNLDELFSKPAERNPQPKPPDPVKVQ